MTAVADDPDVAWAIAGRGADLSREDVMGFNTTVLLYNDQSDSWPKEIRNATSQWAQPSNIMAAGTSHSFAMPRNMGRAPLSSRRVARSGPTPRRPRGSAAKARIKRVCHLMPARNDWDA